MQRSEEQPDTKICDQCAETVKRAAKVCRFCGYEFPIPPPAPSYTRLKMQADPDLKGRSHVNWYNMENFKSEKTIRNLKYLGYVFGPLFIVRGLSLLTDEPIKSIAWLIIGSIIFNPIRKRIPFISRFHINSKQTLTLCTALFFIIGGIASIYSMVNAVNESNNNESSMAKKDEAKTSAQIQPSIPTPLLHTETEVKPKGIAPPASIICSESLGKLNVDENAIPIGSKQPVKTMKKLLESGCNIIHITYTLTPKGDDPIDMMTEYDARTQKLTEIYTSTNVKEEYTGVSKEKLAQYVRSGNKEWNGLDKDNGVAHNFNNREMKVAQGEGEKPLQSAWDGHVTEVERYIKQTANDPSSLEFLEWSPITAVDGYWVVKCKYKGSNAFGGIVTNTTWFYIKNGQVEKTKQGS